MTKAFMPAGVAVAMHDDVVHLIAALGADLHMPIKLSLQADQPRDKYKTLLDYVRHGIESASKQISEAQESLVSVREPVLPLDAPGWKGYHARFRQEVEDVVTCTESSLKQKNLKEKMIRALDGIRSYFVDVERLLVSHNARPEAFPDHVGSLNKNLSVPPMPVADANPQSNYTIFTSGCYQPTAPPHLRDLYDQLMEACFTGDNDKIQELCLPTDGSKPDSQPLQITVEMRDPPRPGLRQPYAYLSGFTPLFVAVCGRKWDTARLVLAIATAQYVPADEDKKFSTKGVILRKCLSLCLLFHEILFDADLCKDDSDSDSDDSDDSDGSEDTVKPQQNFNFTDVAKRSSVIQCQVPPGKMLGCSIYWAIRKTPENEISAQSGSMLMKAIFDNDLEAFVHIIDWHLNTLPAPTELIPQYLDAIIAHDRVELLDEYIRRTGSGINVKALQAQGEDILLGNERRVYLGLSVRGKKRSDLAAKNDPNAITTAVMSVPLLWKAALSKAQGIIAYISGDRPLAAYRLYSSTHSDLAAERLRRAPNLEKALPEWLGWTISPLNESPLTAAILGNSVEVVKKLFALSPHFMVSTLHQRYGIIQFMCSRSSYVQSCSVKFLGYNPIMLAVDRGCDTELFDFLLAKGISPAENDLTNRYVHPGSS
jgi:hypothetical protein